MTSIRTVACCLFLSLTCLAEAPSVLQLRLTLPESTVCKGSAEIPAELVIRNLSGEPVVVSLGKVGGAFDAVALYSTESNTPRLETLQIVGDPIKSRTPQTLKLEGGGSRTVKGAMSLDPAFFSEPGFYKVRTDYFAPAAPAKVTTTSATKAQAVSNWVILQIEPCAGSDAHK